MVSITAKIFRQALVSVPQACGKGASRASALLNPKPYSPTPTLRAIVLASNPTGATSTWRVMGT